MNNFEPVWISSDEHLEKFYDIYKRTSIIGKLFSTFQIPPNYPYLHMYWGLFPIFKVPIVLLASGVGMVDINKFSFRSKPFNVFGSIRKNLLDLGFELDIKEVLQITHTKALSPVVRYYDIPFIRIQTTRDGLLGNFLVCVGGLGPAMKNIVSQTEILFQSLEKLSRK